MGLNLGFKGLKQTWYATNHKKKTDDGHIYRPWRVLIKFRGKHYFYCLLTQDVTDVK